MSTNDPKFPRSRRREEADGEERSLGGSPPPHACPVRAGVGGYRKCAIAAWLVLPAAMAMAAFLFFSTSDEQIAVPQETLRPEVEEGTSLNILTDSELVFKKAFWRRPGPEDKVVQAERLEWTNGAGEVVKWQWFLVVEPSAATREWLAGNPFGLRPASVGEVFFDDAYRPEWFPAIFDDHVVFENAEGRYKLALSKNGTRLYGMDSGFGFAPPETAGASASPVRR